MHYIYFLPVVARIMTSPLEVYVLILKTCKYIMWGREIKVADEMMLGLLINWPQNFELPSRPNIITRVFNVKNKIRKENHLDAGWEISRLTSFAVFEDGGRRLSQRKRAASRNWTREGKEFYPRASRKEYSPSNTLILVQWPHCPTNCKIVNLSCRIH